MKRRVFQTKEFIANPNYGEDVDCKVNKWILENPNYEIIDIKYSVSHDVNNALIIYKTYIEIPEEASNDNTGNVKITVE